MPFWAATLKFTSNRLAETSFAAHILRLNHLQRDGLLLDRIHSNLVWLFNEKPLCPSDSIVQIFRTIRSTGPAFWFPCIIQSVPFGKYGKTMKNTYSCLNVAELEEFGGHIVAGNEWKCRIIREKWEHWMPLIEKM